jgi:hypothetical protein
VIIGRCYTSDVGKPDRHDDIPRSISRRQGQRPSKSSFLALILKTEKQPGFRHERGAHRDDAIGFVALPNPVTFIC